MPSRREFLIRSSALASAGLLEFAVSAGASSNLFGGLITYNKNF